MKTWKCLPFLVLSFCIHGVLFSQVQKKDSLLYQHSFNSLDSFYAIATGANLLIYNGNVYVPSPFSTTGDPFFDTGDLDEGSVFYDGKLYKHVKLQYDLAKDELIVTYVHDTTHMVPFSEKISYFELGAHTFIYMPGLDNNSIKMTAGFYEQLVNNKITLLARREKKFKSSLNPADNTTSYAQYNYYYLQKQGDYYSIKNQKSLLELLKDKKDQLKKYIGENDISFKKDFETALIKVTGYYSQLKN